MDDMRKLINLVEEKSQHKLSQVKLSYSRTALSPVMSSATFDNHYGTLYKRYVDNYNNGSGDKEFNKAGAFLHEKFFTQFKHPSTSNRCTGKVLDLINRNWDSFSEFKKAIKVEVEKFIGSGWVYLSKSGKIKTIKNHANRDDIVLLIDCWEHAYTNDYGGKKGKYVDNLWKIIDWNIINQRI